MNKVIFLTLSLLLSPIALASTNLDVTFDATLIGDKIQSIHEQLKGEFDTDNHLTLAVNNDIALECTIVNQDEEKVSIQAKLSGKDAAGTVSVVAEPFLVTTWNTAATITVGEKAQATQEPSSYTLQSSYTLTLTPSKS
jgi:hypothetical protein